MSMSQLFYTEAHDHFRRSICAFVEKEIEPYIEAWEEAESFPIELYRKAADVGLLGIGFPEAYGGVEADLFYGWVATDELCRAGSGGLMAGLLSHTIGAPPIANIGSEELKTRVLPGILSGEKISCLAITEPTGGSDVANLQTTARREGDHYIVNGAKTFITSGIRADYYTVAVRTGGEGIGGISLLLMEQDTPGFTKESIKKMGWWCSDTATLYFEDCKVPAHNLIGEENEGFMGIMLNFNSERVFLAGQALGLAKTCLHEATEWAKERQTFGKSLIHRQVIRHKLADMQMRILATEAFLEKTIWKVQEGLMPVTDVCLLKNQATQTLEFCAKEAVQILGGMGYSRGTKVERIYRETKVLSIGGGAEEIMKELAVKQMGL